MIYVFCGNSRVDEAMTARWFSLPCNRKSPSFPFSPVNPIPFVSEISQPNHRSGMLAGGNWIIDQVKIIDVYPKHEQLANIHSQSQGINSLQCTLDLAKMGAPFPLEGAGLVGQDGLGNIWKIAGRITLIQNLFRYHRAPVLPTPM